MFSDLENPCTFLFFATATPMHCRYSLRKNHVEGVSEWLNKRRVSLSRYEIKILNAYSIFGLFHSPTPIPISILMNLCSWLMALECLFVGRFFYVDG